MKKVQVSKGMRILEAVSFVSGLASLGIDVVFRLSGS